MFGRLRTGAPVLGPLSRSFGFHAVCLLAAVASCGNDDSTRLPAHGTGGNGLEGCAVPRGSALHGHVAVSSALAPCRITLQSSGITLKIDENGDGPDAVPPILRLASGTFVAASSERDRLTTWLVNGEPDRVVGRTGIGPGEFRRVSAVYVDFSDTVHVSDAPGRWIVFNSVLEHVRTTSSPSFAVTESAAFLNDGNLLLAPPNLTVDRRVFHVVDRHNPQSIRGFGTLAGGSLEGAMQIAYSNGRTFWAASPTKYVLEHWSLDGQRIGSIERRVPWFIASDSGLLAQGTPRIIRLRADNSGTLWVTIRVPDASRRPLPSDPLRTRTLGLRVEVFSTATGELLASEFYQDQYEPPFGFFSDSQGYRIRPAESGIFRVEVVDYRLVKAAPTS